MWQPSTIANQEVNDLHMPGTRLRMPQVPPAMVNPEPQPGITRVLSSDISMHIKSKSDLYHILAVTSQLYLPSIDLVNMEFLRQVLRGKKRLLHMNNLRPCTVPKLAEFNSQQMYLNALKCPRTSEYLPDPSGFSRNKSCGRQFIFNVSILPP